jgi:hypothetical protein
MLHTIILLYVELHAWDGGLSACKRIIMGYKQYEAMNDIVLLAAIQMKKKWDFEAAAEYFGNLEEQPVKGFSDAAMVFQVQLVLLLPPPPPPSLLISNTP